MAWSQPYSGGQNCFGTADNVFRTYVVPTGEPGTAVAITKYGDVGIGTNNPASGYLLDVIGDIRCTGLTETSSRKDSRNIASLSLQEALEALTALDPVRFNSISDKQEERLGFIAEDVPDLVATNDREGLMTMDIIAVLTRVVQQQQIQLGDQQRQIDELQALLGID